MATDHRPIEASYRDQMQILGTLIDKTFNKERPRRDVGFAVLVFPFADTPDGRISYISNVNRSDMILTLKEWLEHTEQLERELEGGTQPDDAA